ncbi:MAG: GID complex subunit 4, VID24, partial [Thelocarpon superellum]
MMRESYLPQLHELDTPVPDLAATLTTAAEEGSSDSPRFHPPILEETDADVNARRRNTLRLARATERMRRERLARTHGPPERLSSEDYRRAAALPDLGQRSYGHRVPQRQSLYDWAPASEEDVSEEDSADWLPPADDVNSSTSSRRRPLSSSSRIPELSRPSQAPELRNLALAQALRRHPRGSHGVHARYDLMNLIDGPGRPGLNPGLSLTHEETESSRSSSRLVRPPSMVNPSERRPRITPSDLRATIDDQRQRYLQNPSSAPPGGRSGSPSGGGGPFEDAIKYLERLRFCNSEEEGLMLAARFVPREVIHTKDRQDFTLETRSIEPPPETSWLRVGAVFEGSQHASGGPNTITRRLSSTPVLESVLSPLGAHYGPHPDTLPTISSARPSADRLAPAEEGEDMGRDDRWPVKVTIQSVDYDTMQLSGEMEAFDVPDRTSPDGKSSITTYLEGEIIDLNTYTLETKSFRSTSRVDGTYWRKLMPFRDSDEGRIAEHLVSKRWLSEHISKQWILMRWK